jgi:hypothetical protein
MEDTTPYGTTDKTVEQCLVRTDEQRFHDLIAWIAGYAGGTATYPKGMTATMLRDDLALIAARCELALNGGDPAGATRAEKRVNHMGAKIVIAGITPCPVLADVKFKEVGGGGQ